MTILYPHHHDKGKAENGGRRVVTAVNAGGLQLLNVLAKTNNCLHILSG